MYILCVMFHTELGHSELYNNWLIDFSMSFYSVVVPQWCKALDLQSVGRGFNSHQDKAA